MAFVGCSYYKIHQDFKDYEETFRLINKIWDVYSDPTQVEVVQERFLYIIDQYQEQPHLLDPHLESMVELFLKCVREENVDERIVHLSFRFFYLVTKVRSYKVIVRLMPHEVTDLNPVLLLLERQIPSDCSSWETRYMLLLWLSMACMIPFDMSRLNSGDNPTTQSRILSLGKSYLSAKDKCRDAAAYLLSRFLTRSDMRSQELVTFVKWNLTAIRTADVMTTNGETLMMGCMSCLGLLCKTSSRDDMLPHAVPIMHIALESKLKTSLNSVLRKLGIKLMQRIALVFLAPRVANWRYQRGSRILAENLKGGAAKELSSLDNAPMEEEEDYDIPEEIEEIIEYLLHGLRDMNTIVRWSAAKGIGRVTGRLPQELANEVVQSLLSLFSLAETESAWHGGCLSLAELARRGLISPKRLVQVMPVVLKALQYDEKRGSHSVGAHVRDAACYVCWAFARAYEAPDFRPFVRDIASHLLIVCVFDREVNVRRAASAAFQEHVGRQGQFPHGIDIVTTCDYFAVSQRAHCYSTLAIFLAKFSEYVNPLIRHLAHVKIYHWDATMRELAAETLGTFVEYDVIFIKDEILDGLLQSCLAPELHVRHGAIIGLAHVLLSLARNAQQNHCALSSLLNNGQLAQIEAVPAKLSEAQLFRGLGGELMRKSVCTLIDKFSVARLAVSNPASLVHWREILDEVIRHLQPEISACGIAALSSFVSRYYVTADGLVDKERNDSLLTHYVQEAQSSVPATRSGGCLAIGSLPVAFISGHIDIIINVLVCSSRWKAAEKDWAEQRRDALLALTQICQAVGFLRDSLVSKRLCSQNLMMVLDALLVGMQDYSLDSRGDVGSWVREAAMYGLRRIAGLLATQAPEELTPEIVRMIMSNLAQQSLEKIDRTRQLACQYFLELLHHRPALPSIPHFNDLCRHFSSFASSEENCSVPADSFSVFVHLLSFEDYAYSATIGIVVSMGGLTESTVHHSSSALFSYLNSCNLEQQRHFCDLLVRAFESNKKQERITLPITKVLDMLLSSSTLTSCIEQNESLIEVILVLLKEEIKNSSNIAKLTATISVFCDLLQFSNTNIQSILHHLMVLLGHKFAHVRKSVATKLYESFIAYDLEFGDTMGALTLLAETQWDDNITKIRPIRNEICQLFNVPCPVVKIKS